MSKASRLIKALLPKKNQAMPTATKVLQESEPEDLRKSRQCRIYAEGDEVWFIPTDASDLFVVKCYVLEKIKGAKAPEYVLDEPLPEPVESIELYPDLLGAINALERKWQQEIANAISEPTTYQQGIILPETDLLLEESQVELNQRDFPAWRQFLLSLFGEALDLTEEDLFEKHEGIDWFPSRTFVWIRPNSMVT